METVVGRRRALVAVLATSIAVLALSQTSSTANVAVQSNLLSTSPFPPSTGHTVRASVADDGSELSDWSDEPQISANGRWQVFTTDSSFPDPDPISPTNTYLRRIFVRDLLNNHTIQISIGHAAFGSPDPTQPVTPDGTIPDGGSFKPSISANGRYVSFITSATNIVPETHGAQATTLVVCDRDPDGDGVFDEIIPGAAQGSQTRDYRCRDVYSTANTDAGHIDISMTPRLSGDGTHLAWTQGPNASSDSVRVSKVVANSGGLQQPSAPVTAQSINGSVSDSQPMLTSDGSQVVMRSEMDNGSDAIVETTLGAAGSAVRLDVDPSSTDPNNPTYLGDRSFTDGEFTAFDEVDQPTVTDDGTQVLFHFFGGDVTPSQSREVLATLSGSQVTSRVVSRGNDGQEVDSNSGTISGDGRFVVFETSAANVHDGSGGAGQEQLVARDLTLDRQRAAANPPLPRLPGALVTVDATPKKTPVCTPVAPAIHCASTGNDGFDISLSDNGSRVAFDAYAHDLVRNDTNGEQDVFVRTWQPAPLINDLSASCVSATTCSFDVGTAQLDTSTEINLPVTVRGFGPLTFDNCAGQCARITGGVGQNALDFEVVSSSCGLLHSGEDCYVKIRFTPHDLGPRTATLSIRPDQYANARRIGTLRGAAGPALTVAPGDTSRASLTDGGAQADPGRSGIGGDESMISGNGRWDVFRSDAALDPTIGNGDGGTYAGGAENIFVRDLANSQHTVQISQQGTNAFVAGDPAKPSFTTGQESDSFSYAPSISDDGRFVSFVTQSEDIVPTTDTTGQENSQTLVVCDRDPNGTTVNGELVFDQGPYACYEVRAGDVQQEIPAAPPRLSGDGTKITWSGSFQCFNCSPIPVEVSTLTDTPGGALRAPSDPLVVPLTGIAGFKSDVTDKFDPVLTRHGTKVVYRARTCASTCRDAVIETTLATSTTPASSVRLDVDPSDPTKFLGNTGWSINDPPATSANGRRVAFAASTVIPTSTAGDTASVVFVRDLSSGKTAVESRTNDGKPAAGYFPALSGDGRYLAFLTDASNMHDGVDNLDSGGCEPNSGPGFAPVLTPTVSILCQVVARDVTKDLETGGDPWVPSELVSSSLFDFCMPEGVPLPPGRTCAGDDSSFNPTIDSTGSEIGFDSNAIDLIAGPNATVIDTNNTIDSFVHTWRPSLSPASVNFGNVVVGSHTDKTATLTETGFGPISLSAPGIAGSNAGDFAVRSTTCTGKTLNDDVGVNTCSVTVRFTPSVKGSRTARLVLPVGKNGYPRQSPDGTISYDPVPPVRPLTGVGTQPTQAIGVVTPSTLDFGSNLPLAPGKTKTVTVTNTGTAPLTVTNVVVQDTTNPGASVDYTVDTTGCAGAVPPGGSCVITVTFVGHAVGNRGASLVITTSASPVPSTVTLKATVPKPEMLVNPGVTPPGRVVQVSGTGFAPKHLLDVTLVGATVQASVKTKADGSFEVNLVIFRNLAQGPQIVRGHTHNASKTISAEAPLLIAVGSVDILQLVTRH